MAHLGASWLRLEVSWVVFGPSWAVSRASWDHLGVALVRLGSSWGHPGATSGRSWAVLGASWGILRASWPQLGASWGRLGSNSNENLDFRSIFDTDFDPRNLKNQAPAAGRARFSERTLLEVNIDFYAIFVTTWLDFGFMFAVLGGSGVILGRLGRVLAPLGGLLGRLWPVLRASRRVLELLGCVLCLCNTVCNTV